MDSTPVDATSFPEEDSDHSLTQPPRSSTYNYTANNDNVAAVLPWTKDEVARERIFTMLSSFYALFVVIVGLVLELSRTLTITHHSLARFKDMLFAVYVYGGGIAFFIYCYSILLNSRWSRPLLGRLSSEGADGTRVTETTSENRGFLLRASHSSPTTGSLYLRLGCIAFGIFGVVYYGLNVLLCVFGWGTEHGNDCNGYTIAISSFAICFIFIQMHFVFCNSKMTIHGSNNIARLGLMHLVAANIWTWIRYILIEEQTTNEEIGHAQRNKTHSGTDMEEFEEACRGVECVLGGFSELMYTCVVEYSLICAGVMFVVWKNVGFVYRESRDKRNHRLKVDCSKTTTGLFFGFAFLVLTIVSMGLFNAFVSVEENLMASWVFFASDAILFLLADIACIYAFWRMRELNFVRDHVHAHKLAELLDRLLLMAGLIGELLFSLAGLVGLTGDRTWTILSVLLVVAHILRLTQVCLQSGLLLLAEKLVIEDVNLQDRKPGKQVITFLLVANAALFLMNTFEAQRAGITPEIVHFYGIHSWVMLVRSCAPLTIFYRFHSSVCFAEIWKHAYTVKEHEEPVLLRLTQNGAP